MKLEVLLSVMNLNKKDLDKMNITSKCTVINQCDKNYFEKYKNYSIYSYQERGASKSRNRGLENVTEDIIILCDDDVIYSDNYEQIILSEFERIKDADVITFNLNSPNRKIKDNNKRKRLHIFNSLKYSSPRIAFKKSSIQNCKIKFNSYFGPGSIYSSGEDTLFLVDCLRKKLKIYSSPLNVGTVFHTDSTWFKGYNEKYFFDKGALFTAINKQLRWFLIIQFLLRHKCFTKEIGFKNAYKLMIEGSNDYLKEKKGYSK